MPRYIFRVVHSESAGKVFVDDNGHTHFLSHACMENDGSARSFEHFDMDDITNQLMCHINGWKSSSGKSFASHFVSTTDSLERAINKAQRHYIKDNVHAVTIYTIDTHTLQRPALVFLMALALRAWGVLRLMPHWKAAMLMYGALTEWIFWDEIVAANVGKTEYGTFAWPQQIDVHEQPVRLQDVIPRVVIAGRHSANTREGVCRSILHVLLYLSYRQERDRQDFISHARATRNGSLPRASNSVKNDKRAQIDDHTLQQVWSLVQALQDRNLWFVWILSMMTQTYYFEHIVKRIVKRHPEVIEESLELVTKNSDASAQSESILVFYVSARDCWGRVDVNQYQTMMLACIRKWYARVRANPDHKYHGIKLYLVSGRGRPVRNLLQPRELGYQGKCSINPLLSDSDATFHTLSFAEIVSSGQPVVLSETNEEHRLRIERETGNIIYAPSGIPMVTTKRVYNDISHLPAQARPDVGSPTTQSLAPLFGLTSANIVAGA